MHSEAADYASALPDAAPRTGVSTVVICLDMRSDNIVSFAYAVV